MTQPFKDPVLLKPNVVARAGSERHLVRTIILNQLQNRVTGASGNTYTEWVATVRGAAHDDHLHHNALVEVTASDRRCSTNYSQIRRSSPLLTLHSAAPATADLAAKSSVG